MRLREQRVIALRDVAGARLRKLPYVLRILLENVERAEQGSPYARHIVDWLDHGTSTDEIPFRPSRILMHDTTCGPALIDVAGMREALADAGGNPAVLNPQVPIDVSVDHSIAVDEFGRSDALLTNMKREQSRNAERFRFMKWAQANLDNVRVYPPGTGIMHTINLEQLATVVTAGDGWLYPDTLIGTDSHTPMVNGLGVLAWGVGGLEAEGVMFGLPVMMRVPDVIGVRLLGSLTEGVLATDLALRVTHELRKRRIENPFVEFFGPGVSSLTVGQRSVVANMAPEFGGQTGYFPIDDSVVAYLEATGRSPDSVALVEEYARMSGLWFDPHESPIYTDTVEIDLSSVGVRIAGPERPQDLREPAQAMTSLADLIAARDAGRQKERGSSKDRRSLKDGDVAIAAITSCTNTSDAWLNIAAGLLARKARAFGLKPKPWVKTSFSPGSPAAALYLARAGLIEDLNAVGFAIVGFGCMTCIGNSGPLIPWVETAIKEEGTLPVAVLSGNRNFPGRVHPLLSAGFLASPPLVVAYALAGTVDLDILSDPVCVTQEGRSVYLRDLWPSAKDIEQMYAAAIRPEDFRNAFGAANDSKLWHGIAAPEGDLYDFEEGSTYLRRPPFTRAREPFVWETFRAHPVLVLGDDITTDQISPAGPIPVDSEAGRYLIAMGDNPLDLNVYSARRGNFEVMVRGLFTNRNVGNGIAPNVMPGYGVDPRTGEHLPLYRLAERLIAHGEHAVILAGERYGAGSSRDWAAKGTALIGVRAVIASSFERIHRTNLIGMGVLPLKAPADFRLDELGVSPGDTIEIALDPEKLVPRCLVQVTVRYGDNRTCTFEALAQIETALERQLLFAGGMVPFILERATG